MIYVCKRNGALINSFETGVNSDYIIEFICGSYNKEIILITQNIPDFEIYLIVLQKHTEDG